MNESDSDEELQDVDLTLGQLPNTQLDDSQDYHPTYQDDMSVNVVIIQ